MPAKAKGLNDALLAVQKAKIKLVKDSKNPHFKNTYASLGAVLEALAPELLNNDLVVTQWPSMAGDDTPTLITKVTHVPSGEFDSKASPLIMDRANMQGLGSAITYARRYALVSIFGLDADEDDDGNAASVIAEKRESGGYASDSII